MRTFLHQRYAGKGGVKAKLCQLSLKKPEATIRHSGFFLYFSQRFFKLFILLLLSQSLMAAEFADIAPLAKTSLLLDVGRHNDLIVAVGERGHILFSHDAEAWEQAKVETRSMLTAVFMLDEKTGWAVGHHAVIVKTIDGGRSWQLVNESKDDEAPLLDVYFQNAEQGIALGAYGLYYITNNGGQSWTQSEITLKPDQDIESELNLPFDLHINAVKSAGQDRLYAAVEAGYLLRSDDNGISWSVLTTPYAGSFFGVLPLTYDQVLLFGLKGHLYRSDDAGNNWRQIETGVDVMLTNASLLNNDDVAITGMSGTLLLSHDKANSFFRVPLSHRHGISALIQQNDQELLLLGDNGLEKASFTVEPTSQ